MNERPLLPVAVLISGSGTTLRNLLEKNSRHELGIEIQLVISSNRSARGLDYARQASIPHHVIRRRDYSDAESHSRALFDLCREAGIQLVVMGGYLEHVLIPPDFNHRVINIHPGLIPAFCGKGYYGHHVHEAVLDYGAKVSGCTVHFVDNVYDHGPIILQRTVPVLDTDTPDTLASRVFEQECLAYPEAIQLIASGRIHVQNRRVLIR